MAVVGDPVATVVALVGGLIVGIVLHELAHFVAGWHLGIVREAGVVVRDTQTPLRFVPAGFYVRQSRWSWWTTLAPLAWAIPLVATVVAFRAGMLAPAWYVGGFAAFFLAAAGTITSDLAIVAGLVPHPKSGERRLVPLVTVDRGERQ